MGTAALALEELIVGMMDLSQSPMAFDAASGPAVP